MILLLMIGAAICMIKILQIKLQEIYGLYAWSNLANLSVTTPSLVVTTSTPGEKTMHTSRSVTPPIMQNMLNFWLYHHMYQGPLPQGLV